MPEARRPAFTALLEILSVIDDIGECVTFHNGLEKDLGGGVTIQRWLRQNRIFTIYPSSFRELVK